jgi:hypothetical protein
MANSVWNPRGLRALPSQPIPTQRTNTSAVRSRAPVLIALTHEVMKAETFESIADLADAVKTAAAIHRIPYNSETVGKAIRSVEARRRLS